MYAGANPRFRARALWLLSKIPGKGEAYVDKAATDADEDIRITAIRARRQLPGSIVPFVQKMLSDSSLQVKRELLLAIHRSGAPEVPAIWATLASAYNGKDRWYLEALGIGADGNWENCFNAWMSKDSTAWKTAAGRDIVWRARAEAAVPYLVKIIKDPAVDPIHNLKYFRAFDFHEGEAKGLALATLLEGDHPQQGFIDAMALIQLAPTYSDFFKGFQTRHRKGFGGSERQR